MMAVLASDSNLLALESTSGLFPGTTRPEVDFTMLAEQVPPIIDACKAAPNRMAT
jgi:hypothetical protein